jgi:hypothetical protein
LKNEFEIESLNISALTQSAPKSVPLILSQRENHSCVGSESSDCNLADADHILNEGLEIGHNYADLT